MLKTEWIKWNGSTVSLKYEFDTKIVMQIVIFITFKWSVEANAYG